MSSIIQDTVATNQGTVSYFRVQSLKLACRTGRFEVKFYSFPFLNIEHRTSNFELPIHKNASPSYIPII